MPSSDPPTVLVTRDGSRTLRAPGGGEGYKSSAGALTEARHVYLEGSGVGDRLRAGQPTKVLEVGFGAGLVFLTTATLAQQTGTSLEYLAVEMTPPSAEILKLLGYGELLAPSSVPEELVAWRESLGNPVAEGHYRARFGPATLTLLVGNALHIELSDQFDAIYHDAFSPTTNPDLWTQSFLTKLSDRLEPGGRLVSFSVAGPVRRALSEAGLGVRKVAGPPGGKREVLVAERLK